MTYTPGDAFYDAGDGFCYWDHNPAVGEYMGLPLCEGHLNIEEAKLLRDCGFPPIS